MKKKANYLVLTRAGDRFDAETGLWQDNFTTNRDSAVAAVPSARSTIRCGRETVSNAWGLNLQDAGEADGTVNGDFNAYTEVNTGPAITRTNTQGVPITVVDTNEEYFLTDAQGNLLANLTGVLVTDNTLYGSAGNDAINGLSGNEALNGGAGILGDITGDANGAEISIAEGQTYVRFALVSDAEIDVSQLGSIGASYQTASIDPSTGEGYSPNCSNYWGLTLANAEASKNICLGDQRALIAIDLDHPRAVAHRPPAHGAGIPHKSRASDAPQRLCRRARTGAKRTNRAITTNSIALCADGIWAGA